MKDLSLCKMQDQKLHLSFFTNCVWYVAQIQERWNYLEIYQKFIRITEVLIYPFFWNRPDGPAHLLIAYCISIWNFIEKAILKYLWCIRRSKHNIIILYIMAKVCNEFIPRCLNALWAIHKPRGQMRGKGALRPYCSCI